MRGGHLPLISSSHIPFAVAMGTRISAAPMYRLLPSNQALSTEYSMGDISDAGIPGKRPRGNSDEKSKS